MCNHEKWTLAVSFSSLEYLEYGYPSLWLPHCCISKEHSFAISISVHQNSPYSVHLWFINYSSSCFQGFCQRYISHNSKEMFLLYIFQVKVCRFFITYQINCGKVQTDQAKQQSHKTWQTGSCSELSLAQYLFNLHLQTCDVNLSRSLLCNISQLKSFSLLSQALMLKRVRTAETLSLDHSCGRRGWGKVGHAAKTDRVFFCLVTYVVTRSTTEPPQRPMLSFKPQNMLHWKLVHPKGRVPRHKHINIVYTVKCQEDCIELYIGETKQLQAKWMVQHGKTTLWRQDSPVYLHLMAVL